jgi:hypothetical protein
MDEQRGALLRAITAARTGGDQAAAVAALDRHDRMQRQAAAGDRELDLSATAVRQALAPVAVHEHHTAATDWLGEIPEPSPDFRTAMIAQAGSWYRSVPAEVRADGEEFAEQARLRAYTAASSYGDAALPARREFLQAVGYLSRGAASGLPQVDQVIDPNNQPSPTPYPTEVFDNFAPQQNDFNAPVESPDHQSQVSSEQAPMLQQVQQQDGSGSGFGSGPELPDQHDTAMDTQYGYAEVPLGPPGVIPTVPAATDQGGAMPQGQSTPNPVAGSDQVADAEPLDDEDVQPGARSASLTPPDWQGYRWRTAMAQPPLDAPWHARCGSLHWPTDPCGSQGHTAAVSWAQTAETFARTASLQAGGFAEGTQVMAAARMSVPAVASHHNQLLGAFTAAARTEDEVHWLHGYLAAVRPLLASAGKCSGCGGSCRQDQDKCEACRQKEKTASLRALANQYIKQRGDKWVILQKGTGKVLSHHDSQEKAEASFRAMMQSKHGSRGRLDFQ